MTTGTDLMLSTMQSRDHSMPAAQNAATAAYRPSDMTAIFQRGGDRSVGDVPPSTCQLYAVGQTDGRERAEYSTHTAQHQARAHTQCTYTAHERTQYKESRYEHTSQTHR